MKELLESYKRGKEKHADRTFIIRDDKGLYYMFGDDAKAAHDIVGTYLFLVTEEHIYATYFSYEDLDSILPKLIRAGKRVAII